MNLFRPYRPIVRPPISWSFFSTIGLLLTFSFQSCQDYQPQIPEFDYAAISDSLYHEYAQANTTIKRLAKIKKTEERLDSLDQVVTLIRMTELENPNSRIDRLFSVTLEAKDFSSPRQTESFGPGEITIPISDRHLDPSDPRGHFVDYNFRIKVDRVTQDLYFYAFQLKYNGAIEFFNSSEESGKVLFQAGNPN